MLESVDLKFVLNYDQVYIPREVYAYLFLINIQSVTHAQ